MDEVMNTPFGEVNAADVEAAVAAAAEADGRRKMEEITIKFAKGLVSEPFVSKDGKELVRIQIPNADPSDRSPWQEFVLGTNQVHENQYGKGLWAKIPADGHTTVSRPFLAGQDENGRNVWDSEKRSVPNRELKKMVEFYKTRGRDAKAPTSSDRETQEKASENHADEAQKAEPDPEKAGERVSSESSYSVKERLEAGKKEAAHERRVKSKVEKKSDKEVER